MAIRNFCKEAISCGTAVATDDNDSCWNDRLMTKAKGFVFSARFSNASIQAQHLVIQIQVLARKFIPSKLFCPQQTFIAERRTQAVGLQKEFDSFREFLVASRIKIQGGVSRHFRKTGSIGAHHWGATRHCFENWKSEPLGGGGHH